MTFATKDIITIPDKQAFNQNIVSFRGHKNSCICRRVLRDNPLDISGSLFCSIDLGLGLFYSNQIMFTFSRDQNGKKKSLNRRIIVTCLLVSQRSANW